MEQFITAIPGLTPEPEKKKATRGKAGENKKTLLKPLSPLVSEKKQPVLKPLSIKNPEPFMPNIHDIYMTEYNDWLAKIAPEKIQKPQEQSKTKTSINTDEIKNISTKTKNKIKKEPVITEPTQNTDSKEILSNTLEKPVRKHIRTKSHVAYKIIADARESAVTKYSHEWTCEYEIKTITTGDYIIMRDNEIAAVIERKTYEDFGASLKDGRYHNKEKLLKLREETGCQIIILLEGKFRPDGYASNIPMRAIESHVIHMMFRDGIFSMQTKDAQATAQFLNRLCLSLGTLAKGAAKVDKIAPVVGSYDANELITRQHTKTDREYARVMWETFSGITAETSDAFACAYSIADIVCGRIVIDNIALNGKKLNKRIHRGLSKIEAADELALLAEIPLISRQSAQAILRASKGLRAILAMSEEQLAALEYKSKSGEKKPLGPAKAKNILRLFNYKHVGE